MMGLLKPFLKPPVSLLTRSFARWNSRRLSSAEDLKGFSRALEKTLSKGLTDQERAVVVNIERQRTSLLNSKEKFLFNDYGAGSSAKELPQAKIEMPIANAASWSRDPFWCLLLFMMVRQFRPKRCLEMGACVGISGSYMAAALKLNNESGQLTTMEGCNDLAKISEKTYTELNLKNVKMVSGLFDDNLDQVIRDSGPIDFAYIDGNHSYEATLKYHKKLKDQAGGDSLILIYDDIHWSPGMKRAWGEICSDSQVQTSVDLRGFGLCFLNVNHAKNHYHIPII